MTSPGILPRVPALGRYELLRPLARGGMADVYLARRRVAGVEKRLVIKRLRKDRHRDPRFLDMFIREAQLSMSLVQQNIVPVFDFGRIGDHVFLAMEYIEGRDLGSSLSRQRGSGLPPMLAAFVAVECCQALDHAHRRREQVIHRDVTARNVLLSWDGEVKLADFGIAAVVGEAAGTFGTPAYMAPEQANGLPVDVRADVYALGIVLWETLIGDHIRPSEERLVTLAVARSGELPEISAAIPPALASVIRRATAIDPEARFATAREMSEALDAFMIVERVREGGQAPGKRLAEWLATRWGDDRGQDAEADEVPQSGAIVTFLDDGEDEVRGGAYTQRSLAETAAEGEPPPEPPPPQLRARAGTLPPPPPLPPGTVLPAAGTDSPARLLLPSDGHAIVDPWSPAASAPKTPAAAPARRRWLLAAIPLAIAAALAAAYLAGAGRRGAPPPADARIALATPDAAGTDDAGPPDAAEPPDAPLLPADAARLPADAALVRPPPRLDAGAASVPDGPLRSIWINALPWAYFTVDNDPKQHETPAMLELSVGTHRVTFANPQLGVSRTVTVVVPAQGEARHVEKMN